MSIYSLRLTFFSFSLNLLHFSNHYFENISMDFVCFVMWMDSIRDDDSWNVFLLRLLFELIKQLNSGFFIIGRIISWLAWKEANKWYFNRGINTRHLIITQCHFIDSTPSCPGSLSCDCFGFFMKSWKKFFLVFIFVFHHQKPSGHFKKTLEIAKQHH